MCVYVYVRALYSVSRVAAALPTTVSYQQCHTLTGRPILTCNAISLLISYDENEVLDVSILLLHCAYRETRETRYLALRFLTLLQYFVIMADGRS